MSVKFRLGIMMFLQYAIWGSWSSVLSAYLLNDLQVGRLVVAAVALALANFLVRGPLADSPSEAGLAALAILLPVTLAVLSLLPERPINHPLILILLGVVIVQSWLVAEIGRAQPSIGDSGVIANISELLTSPDLGRLVFIIAGVLVARANAARP